MKAKTSHKLVVQLTKLTPTALIELSRDEAITDEVCDLMLALALARILAQDFTGPERRRIARDLRRLARADRRGYASVLRRAAYKLTKKES